MVYLRSIYRRGDVEPKSGFPFEVPLIAAFEELELKSPVTFLVGENGSGKSTLLEAIAAGVGAVSIGGDDVATDPAMEPARQLADTWRFSWGRRSRRGFFLRAEDFFNFASRVARIGEEMDELAEGFDRDLSGYGRQLAVGYMKGQKRALVDKYGEDLNANSHGEAFLKLFEARFVPGGLYLLDEPEAPLSPLRQLSLLAILKDMVEQEAQFVIATHSPILMAYPGATIYACDTPPLRESAYDELEHVRLTRNFLKDPQAFLRRL